LGQAVAARLAQAGYTVRVMSRRPRREGTLPEAEWAKADLETGAGLGEALAEVDTVVHGATRPTPAGVKKVDIAGTHRLLEAAQAADASHLLYVSIVGIEHFPYFYYRAKLKAEEEVRAGGVPWTILRATQFHPFLDVLLRPVMRLPVALLPTDFRFQTIDVGEAAARIAELVAAGPSGQAPDLGGPEVLTLGEMAHAWQEARGLHRRVLHLPVPGRIAAGFRAGKNTCPEQRAGAVTWQTWLKETYGAGRVPASAYSR
jgi:uncharacterized protein YbjT (DUF2867 family)